jgi:carbon monoxide dehydrogenase subunit G
VDIEKTLAVAAPPERVWAMLLDPNVMGGCVPGMKSIDVISPTEYVAVMHVKIAFVSAKFKLVTKIVEQRAPNYLRSEGTGEDTSVASSLKQQSEIFLTPLPDGGTELKIKVHVDVLGRLGSFGLSVMKTKADRMWEEFGQNLVGRLEGGEAAPSTSAPVQAAPVVEHLPVATPVVVVTPPADVPAQPGWLSRLLSRGRSGPGEAGRSIRIEVQREGTKITVHWPVEAAGECAALLKECLR